MPKITVAGGKSFEVEPNRRLVLALEDNGVDILHRCGGFAECTTCRVHVHAGEPERMTLAERERLQANLLGGKARLSCQILCDHEMTVEPVYHLSTSDYETAGNRPQERITPEAVWITKPEAWSKT